MIVAATCIFLVAAAFLLLYVNLYNKRKKMHQYEKAQLKQQFETESIIIQMEVQEQTLRTVAAEIHDNVGQLMGLSKLTLSAVDIAKDPVRAQEKVKDTLGLLDTSMKELRHLASVLYGQNVLREGLEKAVEKELEWLGRTDRYKISWNLVRTTDPWAIDPKKELIAFRLIQEVLNNIMKHAEAKSIIVNFEYLPNHIFISIGDDGKGFDVEKYLHYPVGLGLQNLKKRAAMISSDLQISSDGNNGTCVSLTIPYRQ